MTLLPCGLLKSKLGAHRHQNSRNANASLALVMPLVSARTV